MRCHPSVAFLLFVVAALHPSSTRLAAQNNPAHTPPTINTEGIVGIKVKPDEMRMALQLVGTGKDKRLALEHLNERIEVARTQLRTWGAVESSIKTSKPKLPAINLDSDDFEMEMDDDGADNNEDMEKREIIPLPVFVTAHLAAKWKLEAEKPHVELLLAASELQEKIKLADLGGWKESLEQLPEKIRKSIERNQYRSNWPVPRKVGDPLFAYVGTVDEPTYRSALKRAFANAQSEAEVLADTAGRKLGPLRSLSNSRDSGMSFMGSSSEESWYRQFHVYDSLNNDDFVETPFDTLELRQCGSPFLEDIDVRISVTASFALEP